MADFSFSSKRSISTSLGLRVLSVSLVLLVLPLLFSVLFILFTEEQAYSSRLLSHLFVLVGSIIVIGGMGAIWLTRRMGRPLKQLAHTMSQVGKGNLEASYKSDPMGFEINLLGKQFNRTVSSLATYMEAKERLESELKIGQEIQKSILPKSAPHLPGLDVAGGFLSAKEVGGDFCDFLVKEDKLILAIADASGKGISACLHALGLRSLLRSDLLSADSLSDALHRTNDLFCLDTGDSGFFVTAWVGQFDPKYSLLSYVSCGHPPAFLYHADGTVETLTSGGVALGVLPGESFSSQLVRMKRGDLLLLYTDGVTEALRADAQQFGKERLHEMVRMLKGRSSQEISLRIIQELQAFSEGKLSDDLTLVVVQLP
jgi:sigma-B regulation protein RsbU (phosphoserine phosphatase)